MAKKEQNTGIEYSPRIVEIKGGVFILNGNSYNVNVPDGEYCVKLNYDNSVSVYYTNSFEAKELLKSKNN